MVFVAHPSEPYKPRLHLIMRTHYLAKIQVIFVKWLRATFSVEKWLQLVVRATNSARLCGTTPRHAAAQHVYMRGFDAKHNPRLRRPLG